MPVNLIEYNFNELMHNLDVYLHPADLVTRLRTAGYTVTKIKNSSFSTDASIQQIQEVLNNG
jgi:tRNA G26 N,N-dimethylase Trm1